MAERNLEWAEGVLNTIKTGAPAERQAAVKELVRAYSPLLSKEYEKLGGTDDKERKTTLLSVFRETFADTSALQSVEVFERTLYANFMKSVNSKKEPAEVQNTISTTQMANLVADEAKPDAQEDDEPVIVFGTGKPAAEPAVTKPEAPAEDKPVQNSAPQTIQHSEPEAEKPAAAAAEPAVVPVEKKTEPASSEAESPAEPKPEKRKPAKQKPAKQKPAKSSPEEDEEGGGLPVWAVAILGVVAAVLLFAILLLGLRSFAPSAYNGIAGALNSVLPVDLPLTEAAETGATEEPEPAETAETAETAEAPQQEATAEPEAEVTPEQTPEPTPEPTPEGPAVIGRATVNVEKLNLREEPNTTSAQKGQAERGRTYDVYEISNDGKYTWYRVDDNLWFADDGTWVTFEEN